MINAGRWERDENYTCYGIIGVYFDGTDRNSIRLWRVLLGILFIQYIHTILLGMANIWTCATLHSIHLCVT